MYTLTFSKIFSEFVINTYRLAPKSTLPLKTFKNFFGTIFEKVSNTYSSKNAKVILHLLTYFAY